MKKITSILIAITGAFFISGWTSTPETIRQAFENIQSIQADFIQEKHLKILSKPLISKGYFIFQKPNSFRWEYISPVQSILLMQKGNIKRYLTSSGQWVEDSSVSLQGMEFIMQEMTQWLKGNFDNPLFTAELKQPSRIIMTPKEASFAKLIHRIELLLSETPGIMESVIIYENETDYTQFTFSKPTLNVKIEAAVFETIR